MKLFLLSSALLCFSLAECNRVKLPKQTLVVLGGNSGKDFLDSVEAVSLSGGAAKQCSPIKALPNAVDGITPTNIGPVDSPVVCGGLSEGDIYRNECFVYQPYRNTWQLLGRMMNTRTEYGIAQIDKDRFIVAGGFNGNSLAATEIFNCKTGTFTKGTDMPSPTRRHSMAKINSTHLVSVGNFDGAKPVNQVLLYNIDTQEWTELPGLTQPRFGLGLGLAVGKDGEEEMVVTGGPKIKTTEIFNFRTMEWRAGGDLPRDVVGSASIQVGNSFVLAGGRCVSCGEFTNKITEYDPISETWSDRDETFPTGRFRHAGLLVSDYVTVCRRTARTFFFF